MPAQISYGGLRIIRARYTNLARPLPGVCVLRCEPSVQPVDDGILRFEDANNNVYTFTGCRIYSSRMEEVPGFTDYMSVHYVQDRRWRFTTTGYTATYVPGNTYNDIIAHLLFAAGEASPDISVTGSLSSSLTLSGSISDSLKTVLAMANARLSLHTDNRIAVYTRGPVNPPAQGQSLHRLYPLRTNVYEIKSNGFWAPSVNSGHDSVIWEGGAAIPHWSYIGYGVLPSDAIVTAAGNYRPIVFQLAAVLTTSMSSVAGYISEQFGAGVNNDLVNITLNNTSKNAGGYKWSGAIGAKGVALWDSGASTYRIIDMECP